MNKKWYCVSFVVMVSLFCGTGRVTAQAEDTYMVVTLPDVPGGDSSVAYLSEAPAGGWTDEYKTDKLVLKRIPRGEFAEGVALDPIENDFYIGVFEVTVGQFARLSASYASLPVVSGKSETEPAVHLDFGGLDSGNFTCNHFLSRLNASVDLVELPTTNTVAFALPSAEAWEFACRAGSSTDYYYGNDAGILGDYAWFVDNSDTGDGRGYAVQNVGGLEANAWGLYDMLGNVAELVAGGAAARGGAWDRDDASCMCASSLTSHSGESKSYGFRVYLEIPTDYFKVTVVSGTSDAASYTNGQLVTVTATVADPEKRFDRWTGPAGLVFADATAETTTFTMPGSNITVTATSRFHPYLTVVSGTGSGYYTNGVTVSISATPTNAPWMFAGWTGPGGVVFDDATAETTTLVMPDANTTVTATYKSRPILTVLGGSGGGQYETGTEVSISADPPPAHYTFLWVGQGGNAPVANAAVDDRANWNNAKVTMPGNDITLEATYTAIWYPVTVTGGSGSGDYTNGTVVTIAANLLATPHVFDKWVGDTYILEDPLSATTRMTVDVAAKVAAAYRPVQVLDRAYLVVNLAGAGGTTYTNATPVGGWTNDLYKTGMMVFKKVPAGTFTMGGLSSGLTGGYPAVANQVTLTEAFYMGLYPVTQAQWTAIRGSPSGSVSVGLTKPVENVSYETLRGSDAGAQWPASAGIDSDSFIAAMRTKAGSGFNFDLPTEAQWEYTCRAGTTTAYSFGDNASMLGTYAWFSDSAGGTTQPVGEKLPNPWGLYDMHGNVSEWCRDWFSGDYGAAAKTDPKGGTGSSRNERIVRGGNYRATADECRSARRSAFVATNGVHSVGFRLVWTVGVEYSFTVANGLVNTNGLFAQGIQIPISAEDRSPVWKFLRWDVSPANASLGSSFSANNANTIVTMPNRNVALTAVYQVNDGYTALTVVNGTGSGSYTNGTVVTIVADDPEAVMDNPWFVFDRWTGDTAGVTDVNSITTTVATTGGAFTLTATYKIMDPLPSDVHLLTTVGNGAVKIFPVQEGAAVSVTAPPPPSASFAFGWWVVEPEGVQLGTGFNEKNATTTVTMPDTDVSLTAIYVKDPGATPGYLDIRLVDSITGTNLVTALWSTDGKDFVVAASNYPLRPGAYTLRFQSPSLNWLTPANVKVTIKAGQTVTLAVPFVWVPVVTGAASGGGPLDTVTRSPANGQVLPGRTVTLTARPSKTSVFVEWVDGVLTASRQVAPETNATYMAIFRPISSYTTPPVLSPGTGTPVPTVGVLFSHTVGINERPAKFAAKGLPAGLKINAATGEIFGVPTKAGTFPVVITATNPNKLAASVTETITIAPLSPYAQGAFTGYLTNGTAEVVGAFTMKVSAAGALSVKVTVRNAAVSFSTKGWFETDGAVYTAEFLTKKGEALALSIDTTTWRVAGSTVGGKIGTDVLDLEGCWDLFKVNKKAFPADHAFAMAELAKYQGYYTVALPVTDCVMRTPGLDNIQEGAGYLALTVNKSGGVKVAGVLPDGTKLSTSTTLLYMGTEAAVPVFAPLYSKRGMASGLLTVLPGMVAPDANKVAPGLSVAWQWLYPGKSVAATLDGFGAALEPFGAFYAKVASIEAYYSGAALTTAVDSVSMEIPLVFNAKGVASLSTEATENTVGAKLTVKPATGLFNGTFQRTPPGLTKPATVKYLGVLTRDAADGYVGYGAYVLPQTEKVGTMSYNLKPSYPVVIE